MATPEIANAFREMSGRTKTSLGLYYDSLQHRFGDPEVYAAQQEEINAQAARVQYSQAKSRESALEAAYNTNRQSTRSSHANRMSRITQDKPQRSSESPPDCPNPKPPGGARPARSDTSGARRQATTR